MSGANGTSFFKQSPSGARSRGAGRASLAKRGQDRERRKRGRARRGTRDIEERENHDVWREESDTSKERRMTSDKVKNMSSEAREPYRAKREFEEREQRSSEKSRRAREKSVEKGDVARSEKNHFERRASVEPSKERTRSEESNG